MGVVKRYSNRKLYDTRAKQYVTLDGLAELIRQGEDVSVVDHPTGEDITVLTLAQIIVEQEKKERGWLPQAVLKGMIQASSRALWQLRWALPWTAGRPSPFELELEQRIRSLVARGQMSAAEGTQLAAALATAATSPTQDESLNETALRALLAERGVPTRQDLQTLADQLDNVASNLDQRLSRRQPTPP
jgi:polyhydroxyalkanoate synthesis repressor PhaR